MFVFKSQEEIENMTAEEFKQYQIDKDNHIKETEKSLKKAQDRLHEAVKNKADKEEIQKLSNVVGDLKDKAFKDLMQIVKSQGEDITVLMNGGTSLNQKEVESVIEENFSEISELVSNNKQAYIYFGLDSENKKHAKVIDAEGLKGNGRFITKAPDTMTVQNNVVGERFAVIPPENQPGINGINERVPFITEFTNTRNTSSETISWKEEVNPEGDAQFTGENTLKSLYDFELQGFTSQAKKVTIRLNHSTEIVQDVEELTNFINTKLRIKHDLRLEQGIISGDGLGDNLKGILEYAPAFIPGGLAASIDTPNNFDAIRSAINQVVVSSEGMFYPTVCFINPTDAAKMDMAKGDDGHYIMPPFTAENGVRIKGVRLVEKVQIDTDNFLLGDFLYSNVRPYIPFMIQIGYNGDDFANNRVTIIGESRTHHYIYENDVTAFVADQFSVVIPAIEKI